MPATANPTIYDLPFLSETDKRKMLGDNARKLFKLDISDRFPGYRPPG